MTSQMMIHIILVSSKELFFWVCGFFVLFSLLAKLTPCNRQQPVCRKDALTDIVYCFFLPIVTRFVRILLISGGVYIVFHGVSNNQIVYYMRHGYGPLARMPIWLQAAIVILVSDVILYWFHRWFHTKAVWRFHAIHHSSPHVDWLSTYRFHPINTWLSFTLVDVATLLVGFSPAAVIAMASVNMIYSAMVHANLNWTFGRFKYLFASPVFHRWHHTSQEEGMDKNFAPTFPLLDIMFGTFYMPDERLPEHYGVPGSNIPSSFIGQMIWPFRKQP